MASSPAKVGHPALDADAGFDLNYGAAKGLQLTATLPISFSRDPPGGWRSGTGDLELAVKYRFMNDEKHGLSAAIFPRAILPTSRLESHERTRFLLPVWLGKDFAGGTSISGGGGYEINPGLAAATSGRPRSPSNTTSAARCPSEAKLPGSSRNALAGPVRCAPASAQS